MSGRRGQFEGYPYLSKPGASFRVRVQVPASLRTAVGKGELIKLFGSDFSNVRRNYHRTVADFKAQIEAARVTSKLTYSDGVPRPHPERGDIELACHAFFNRMARTMRGKVAEPVGDKPRTRTNRIEGYQRMIENHVDAYESDNWETMATQAEWLCEEHGWLLAEGDAAFEFLCRTMLRARLQCYKGELRQLEGKIGPDPDGDPLFGLEAPNIRPKARTLGQLIDKFTEVREQHWSSSTQKNYIIINRVLEEICGRETLTSDIDSDFCRKVQKILVDLPANYQKLPQTMGRPIGEAIEIAKANDLTTIKPATVNSHLNKLGAIVRFGRDEGWVIGNPMANIGVHDPIDPAEKRDPFTIPQLCTIFATDPWNSAPLSAQAQRPSRYWAPLIALFSGARLTDICGQRVDEMIEEEGVRLFNFVHRPGERHVKGGRSRKVPVHPKLVQLGFWQYVEEVRLTGQEFLFSDTKRDGLGKWGDSTSKWFARKIKRIELAGRCLSMHSFRHTFEDALRRSDLHDTPIGNAITGRTSPGVSKNYGSKYPVHKLRDAVNKVSFPGFNFPE